MHSTHAVYLTAFATIFTVPVSSAVLQTTVRTKGLLTNFPGQGALPDFLDILRLNLTRNTFLPLSNIQGDIFVGMKKPVETFIFFEINDATAFKTALRNDVVPLITSAETLISPPARQPLAFLNIGFGQTGLTTLGITDNLGDANFAGGQLADAPSFGDVIDDWDPAWKTGKIHGALLIGSDEQSHIDNLANIVKGHFGSSIHEVTRLAGAARPGAQAGHEHFGFLDGISNPAITGFATDVLPGQALIPTGIILTGRLGDRVSRPQWALDGSFMVFRKLQQLVPEFNDYLVSNAVQNAAGTLTTSQGADLLGARMVGRWKSGAPMDITPEVDNPSLGSDPTQNNNFDFNHIGSSLSSDQSRCPFAAHIRKTRPRADLSNTNFVNQGIRAGIPYGPEVTDSESSSKTTSIDRGLAFVEYQSVIANGFRFQQLNWMNDPNFAARKNQTVGLDPITGQAGNHDQRIASGLDPRNAAHQHSVPEFVKPLGGEYFFNPSISALKNTIAA